MSKRSLQIGIPVLIILLVAGVSALLFKFRYDKTVETRKMENAVRDAARSGTIFPTEGVGTKEIALEDSPVEKSIALTILSPSNGTQVTSSSITVRGKTVANADVFVNEKEGKAGTDGVFQVAYTLDEGENTLLIVASDADGNATEEELTVIFDSGNP